MQPTAAITLALLLAAAAPQGNAAIVLTGDFRNGSTNPVPTLTVTEDIVFTLSGSGTSVFVVLDGWTIPDAGGNAVLPTSGQTFLYEINGTGGSGTIGGVVDNSVGTVGEISGGDGYFAFFGPGALTAGTTLTLKAKSYTYSSDPNFNSMLNGKIFTGEVFLADSGGVRLSNNVAVPEPSVLLIGALALPVFFRRKR